jgi:hypothetical protein
MKFHLVPTVSQYLGLSWSFSSSRSAECTLDMLDIYHIDQSPNLESRPVLRGSRVISPTAIASVVGEATRAQHIVPHVVLYNIGWMGVHSNEIPAIPDSQTFSTRIILHSFAIWCDAMNSSLGIHLRKARQYRPGSGSAAESDFTR